MKLKISVFFLFFQLAFLPAVLCNYPGKVKQGPSFKKGTEKTEISSYPAQSGLSEKAKKLTNIARFIAGMPTDTLNALYPYSCTPEWKAYHQEATQAWAKFDKVAGKIINWREKEFPAAVRPVQTIFYPFGGPDYLFANIFFPNATNYILMGLESPGSIPQIDASNKDSLKSILDLYKVAIEDVIQLSFFRTVDMKNDLTSKAIDGTAPIIMLFLARSGKEILDVEPMVINDEGTLVAVSAKKRHNAIRIDFKNPGDTVVRHVFYLSANLADPSLSKNKPFIAYLNHLGPNCTSFIKSATYLMHKSYFSIIRNTVLSKSQIILQDDSGIAFKFFNPSLWDITLFGSYTGPISMFKEHYEPDLAEAYKKVNRPLDFRYGYNQKSNLLLARRKPDKRKNEQ